MNRFALVSGLAAGLLLLGGCAGTPAAAPAPEPAASTPIDGKYRVVWTTDELAGALEESGMHESEDTVAGNSGEVYVTFDAGRYDIAWVGRGESCPGTFEVEGDRVVMTATADPSKWDCGDGVGQLAGDAVWTIDGPALTLSDWNLSPEPAMDWFNAVMLGAKPLERVE